MSKKTVRAYDTIVKKYVDVEVSEKIFNGYNRSQWNIDDNNKSFYKHEIQFSSLKGNLDGSLDNFKEFRTVEDLVENHVIRQEEYANLHKCLSALTDDERKIITMIYFENKTEHEAADILHTSQQNIHKKKIRILCRLHNLLKNQ